MTEPFQAVWDTLLNAQVRINWNNNSIHNYLEIEHCGKKFRLSIDQYEAEYLLAKFGRPQVLENVKMYKKHFSKSPPGETNSGGPGSLPPGD